MSPPKNKYSRDGFEIGASKIGVIIFGENDYGLDRETLRQMFVDIRKNPDVIHIDNVTNKDAKDRGNYLEDGILNWVADQLDQMCEEGVSYD